MKTGTVDSLRDHLEGLHARWHRAEHLRDDPLWHAHRYGRAGDQEVVAFIAAGFAWGNVRAIDSALQKVFAVLGEEPASALAGRGGGEWRRLCEDLVHRRIHGADVAYLFGILGEVLRVHGSLGGLWGAVDDAGEATVVESARRFLVGLSGVGVAVPVDRGFARGGGVLKQGVGLAPFGYGVPGAGSPMKRCCLFLRWMGRHADGVDLGLWPHVSPSRLVVPLDVHVLRTARALGLTGRRDATLRTAVEVTRSLSEICPEDPCRYDFAMVRAGIEDRRVGASKGFRE